MFPVGSKARFVGDVGIGASPCMYGARGLVYLTLIQCLSYVTLGSLLPSYQLRQKLDKAHGAFWLSPAPLMDIVSLCVGGIASSCAHLW